MRTHCRFVLDTNVVLDWLVFEDPSVRALARAIEAGEVEIVTTPECTAELRRVLGYPEFGLDEAAQAAALARYQAHARVLEHPARPGQLPRCSDPDDQKFLELAFQSKADSLLTRDKALLRLTRRVAGLARLRIERPGGSLHGAAGL